jgi:hypothetical protein
MIVGVRTSGKLYIPDRWVEVPDSYEKEVRQVAFRKVFRRKEKDFQELMDHTWPVSVETVTPDGAELLLSLTGYGQK